MGRRRILVLGATGQVGRELRRTLVPLGEVLAASRDGRHGLSADLADLRGLRDLLETLAPDLVVNAAAYTAVDRAESEPDLARRVNAEAPGVIGAWAARRGVPVIHYSTDYVFDGSKPSPYLEEDAPNPLGVYGATKLAGDQALLASDAPVVILRVGWVYGLHGQNFLRTMQRLMAERDQLQVVDDQIGAPTWSRMIAEASAQVAGQLLRGEVSAAGARGVYHLSPAGETSWYGFATAIRDLCGLHCDLRPIPAEAYPTPARRPASSRLDAGRLRAVFGIGLPDWREGLALCMEERPVPLG